MFTLKKLAELTGKGISTNHLEIINKIPSINLIIKSGKYLKFTFYCLSVRIPYFPKIPLL